MKGFPSQEPFLTFGDQLTCERIAGLIRLMQDDVEDYTAIVPCVADWHARQAYVMVCLLFFLEIVLKNILEIVYLLVGLEAILQI